MTNPPEIPVKSVRRSLLERVSVVWLIPVAALVIALGVAFQSWSDRGPLIVITFESASGVKAGETVLRFRDVDVGLVEKVSFTKSLEKVDVSVRLDKEIAPFVDGDAEFWVVRPEVTAQGVSGLDTVLSGVFIEGLWNTAPEGLVVAHNGLPNPPLLRVGETGLRIILRAKDSAQLSESSPILFKGIRVGRMGKPRLSEDGSEAVAEAIIYAPHDELISSATRFWDTSGFSFKIGANGAELDFTSIASLISGGLTFETIVSGGEPVVDGAQFVVYSDEPTARASLFSDDSGPRLSLAVVFDENVSGLTAGSPVEYGGVRVGEVTGMRGLVDEARFNDKRVRLQATLEVQPERLGLGDDITPDAALQFLSERVVDGLRARLATASILTGGLKIELLRVADAPPAVVETPADGLPVLPSTESNIQDVAATAQGVLKRVNDLPVEELMGSIITFLDNASALVGGEDLQKLPTEAMGLLSDARGVLGAEGIQELPTNVNALMISVQGATEDLRKVLVQIEAADTVNRLMAAVDAAGVAAGQVGTALEGVPGLIAQIETLAAKANGLPLEDLLAQATALVGSTQELMADQATKALPATLNAAMSDLQKVVADLTAQDGIARLLATIDAAGAAATQVSGSVEGVPALITQIEALANKANGLPLEDLLTQATALVGSANTLLDSDSTKALPGALNAAMADLQKVIAEITAQDGVARLMAAIDAAGTAAVQAGASFEGVPDLVAQLNAVAEKANELPLDQLVTELTAVVGTANTLLSSEGAKDLPANLSGALEQLDAVLTELREGGTVENVNKTLASAANAANSIASATTDLPNLVTRINSLVSQATKTLAGFDDTSQLNRDVRSALRELQRAAEAVSSLSRTIERRPNSIILGR